MTLQTFDLHPGVVTPAVLPEWSAPESDISLLRNERLHELFEATADRFPDRPALTCAGQTLTYRQLDVRANQLAAYLRSQGVGRGDCVGLLLPRSAEVYIALLAILKAGAAYVPLDPDYPPDRVAYILNDCDVRAVVTSTDLGRTHQACGRKLLAIDALAHTLASQPAERPITSQADPTDLCYVIYTSGSTGRPKGVQIEHRNACHLVRAEGKLFDVTPADRVYQGFSIAFDASVEEVWLAFFSGATLVAGTAEMVRSGPALAQTLARAQVTVLSTVPTLLSMFEEDIPSLRLLILGGEACPQHLARRWCKPGRRMVNTYGPTEATVIATWADLSPEAPVTIGRPVANYQAYILDEDRQPVAPGETGELYLGGAGVARGYVGRPDLTAERFLPDPFGPNPAGRIYRTGDLGRFTKTGLIEFMGRADTQVKIRGFRVELSEIESALLRCPGVKSAVVALREDPPGVQQLVGYIIPRPGHAPTEDDLRATLRKTLPVYMVPSLIETLADFPTLPSGKVDRKSLPAPAPRQRQTVADAPITPREKCLATVWGRLFYAGPDAGPPSVTADFFLDLGGHSLLAATMVSELRRDPLFADLSVLDVYQHPTIRRLAAALDARRAPAAPAPSPAPARTGVNPKRYRRCATAQLVLLYFILGFASVEFLAPYLTYGWLNHEGVPVTAAIAIALGVILALFPAMLLASIGAKWALLGRIKPGGYPLWGGFFLRWWLVQRIVDIAPVESLAGTPLLGWYYRAMGARIGKNVYLDGAVSAAFDLLTVGDDASIGAESSLAGYTVENGQLVIGPITLGRRCFVGARSVLRRGTRMDDDARLGDLSLLPENTTIPAGQTWSGSPAAPEAAAPQALAAARPSVVRRAWFTLLHVAGIVLLPAVYLAAIFPGVALLNWADRTWQIPYLYLVLSPVAAVSFVILLALEIIAVKWLLLGRVKPGAYPVHSWFYVRKWFVDGLMAVSLDLLGPLYATLYLPPWYRALGAKLGKHAEISTACSASPDLCDIGEGSFVADAVSLGHPRVEGNTMTLLPTTVGKRSFVGNSAAVACGTRIGDNALVGCLSMARPEVADDTSWLGSPPVFLPQRQQSAAFSEEQTYRPTAKLYIQRLCIELARILLAPTVFVALTGFLISTVVLMAESTPLWQIALAFPLMFAGCGLAAVLVCVGLKWLVVGRYRPQEQPLWSTFVWKSEFLNAVHENLARSMIVEMAAGTPLVPWFFRMLGSRIGQRVYMESLEITEFDLVTIGDDAAINADATLQTHLFEDRVMKMSTVSIGAGASIGAGSVVLYDTQVAPGAVIRDLTLVMKGEQIPPAIYQGSPARKV